MLTFWKKEGLSDQKRESKQRCCELDLSRMMKSLGIADEWPLRHAELKLDKYPVFRNACVNKSFAFLPISLLYDHLIYSPSFPISRDEIAVP